jgi:ABC-type transport system involved in multi-copper enzyme maturation permease subunit
MNSSKQTPAAASVHPSSFVLHPSLLHYRPWRGALTGATGKAALVFFAVQASLLVLVAVLVDFPVVRLALAGLFVLLWGLVVRSRAWPIGRVAIEQLLRRRLFWALYALALLVFLMFFFGQYLMSWATTQLGESDVRVGNFVRANPRFLVRIFSDALKLNGSAETFRNFFSFESYNVMVVLALAGAVLIGNDLRFGSLPFYLSKPISRWDYLAGKSIAVAVFINLFTTLPAVGLWVQFGLLEDWDYFVENAHLLVGVLGYGLVLTVSLTALLLATATWLRKTVPLIMTWTTLFFFCRLLANALVDGLHLDPRWRLIDLWNCGYVLGNKFLGIDLARLQPGVQPAWHDAAVVLGAVSILCTAYTVARLRAVEIVS